MATKIFVNLPVKDLNRSKEFFEKLGYTFNPQFSDDKGACLVIDDAQGIYGMLLTETFFKSFVPNLEIADASKTKEVLIALSCDSREAVDQMMEKAIAAGGKEAEEKQYLEFMYGRAFSDLDNHIWELFYMDMSKVPPTPAQQGQAPLTPGK